MTFDRRGARNYTKGRWRWVLFIALMLVLLLNLVAARHAWRFTHPVAGDAGTPRPESLSLSAKLWTLVSGVEFRRARGGDPLVRSGWSDQLGVTWRSLAVDDGLGALAPVWWLEPPRVNGTALLVHGYGGERGRLLPVARHYLSRGLQVLLVDLPGHGSSPHGWTSLGVKEARVVAAVARYRAWQRPLLLHGRSMGAAAVIGALADGVRADGAVLEAPYASLPDTVCRRFQLMGLPCFPLSPLLLAWGGLFTGTNPFAQPPREQMAGIELPVLLMGGLDDRRVPFSVVTELAAGVAGDSQAVGFEGAGHQALEQVDPERYEAVLGAFLRRTTGL